VQSVTNKRTGTHVNHFTIDDEPTNTTDEAPLYASTPTHQTHIPVPTDVQLSTRSNLTQPPLSQAQRRQHRPAYLARSCRDFAEIPSFCGRRYRSWRCICQLYIVYVYLTSGGVAPDRSLVSAPGNSWGLPGTSDPQILYVSTLPPNPD